MAENVIDFLYTQDGSMVILTPVTHAAEEWLTDNLPDETPKWGKGVAIEFNYAGAILHGLLNDGFMLQRYA